MSSTFGGIKVTAQNAALTVTLTQSSGVTPAVYSDAQGQTALSLPITVSAGTSTTLYVTSPGSYNLSVNAGGVEIAAPGSTTLPVSLDGGGGGAPGGAGGAGGAGASGSVEVWW